MQPEERIKVLEEEFEEAKGELKKILMDIRIFLMEAQTPIRADWNMEGSSSKSHNGRRQS